MRKIRYRIFSFNNSKFLTCVKRII